MFLIVFNLDLIPLVSLLEMRLPPPNSQGTWGQDGCHFILVAPELAMKIAPVSQWRILCDLGTVCGRESQCTPRTTCRDLGGNAENRNRISPESRQICTEIASSLT